MSLSEIAIRRPVFAWMLMASLILFGAICFNRMGISQLPDVDFPVISIGLKLPNAAPEVMENDVVDPVEDAVMGIEGIRTVTSNSSQGKASVVVEFDLGRNVDVALQEVQTRIAQAVRRLPQQLEPPVISKTNPEDQPILWVILTAADGTPLNEQMNYARNVLKDKFSTLSGVGTILFGGYVDPSLRVHLSPQKLKTHELTADDVTNAIQSEQVELPAGRIENQKSELNVRLLGEASNIVDFGKIRILQRGGSPNYKPLNIASVGRVEEGLADIRSVSRYNGKSAVGLGIVKQRGSNAVDVSKLVHQKVKDIAPSLPKGYQVDVRLDSTKFIKEAVDELNFTLILSAILTSVVCFLFLASWSSTFNVLLSIPTSIIGCFIVLYFFKFTLNTFTLLGLSLAIGIVVDDAIMMLENIIRHRELGLDRIRSALVGAKEITFAALAATVAIAAIFLPVVFMKGVIGKFFYQFGVTITGAVFLSLLEALTLTPMRCSQIGGSHNSAEMKGLTGMLARFMDRLMDKFANAYKSSLRVLLNFRWTVMILSCIGFAASMWTIIPMNKELMPEQDQSQFLLTLRAPVGTSLQTTNAYFKKAEDFLSKQKEVLEYYSSVGGYQGQDIVNTGTIFVTMVEPHHRKISQGKFIKFAQAELRKQLPEIEVFGQDLSLSGFSASRGYPVEFTVQGPNWETLSKANQELINFLKEKKLVTDINTDIQGAMPEIRIIPNRDEAAARGISIAAMGDAVSTMIGGKIFTSGTQYPKDGRRYEIRVRSDQEFYSDPNNILSILVRNNRGSNIDLIPLGNVVKIEKRESLSMITRLNRERAIQVFANVPDGASQQEVLNQIEKYAKEKLPPGYRANITGSAQTFRESFDGLIFALLLGIIVSYMVLASQFNSFVHPITILMALPFSLSGAFVSLYFTHQSLNLFSMIGLILLMGIVKKNSILLVDFTNAKRDEGLDAKNALIEACPVRLRPILMTSIATIAGAIPAAISFGPGSETRVPMAIAIIGGVLVSTVLTLFVVPCAYSLFTFFERPDKELENEIKATSAEIAVTGGAH